MKDLEDTPFYNGRSMVGTFRLGDRLTVARVAISELLPGDVVVYRGLDRSGEETAIVHRVVGVTPAGLVARGDANLCVDATLVTAANLTGKVVLRERGGRQHRVIGGRLGLLAGRSVAAKRRLRRLMQRFGRFAYAWLRRSGIVTRVWRPSMSHVRLLSHGQTIIKVVHRGRTIAEWLPEQRLWWCRKPYDLVITAPPPACSHGGA